MGRIGAEMLLALAVTLPGTRPVTSGSNADIRGNELPMEVHNGYLIVVEGSIGRLQGLKFLLDTGVTRSVVDQRVANKLDLPRWTGTLINFDKTVRIESCQVPELAFGPEYASNVKMTVADMGYLDESGVHVDAVIGWDLLRRKSFRLDFVKKLVVFQPREHRGTNFASIRPSDLFLMVEANLGGRPVWMVADTGAQRVTFYQSQLSRMGADYRIRGGAVGRSIGGTIAARIVSVSRFRLGTQDLDRTVELVEAPLSGPPEGIAGYLGFSSLHAKEIEFNFEKNELRWAN